MEVRGNAEVLAKRIKSRVELEHPIDEDLRRIMANHEIRTEALLHSGIDVGDSAASQRIERVHRIETVLESAAAGIATKKEIMAAADELEHFGGNRRDMEPAVDAVLAMRDMKPQRIPTEVSRALNEIKKRTLADRWGNYHEMLLEITRAYNRTKKK
ncbi:Uncharacterised protein [Candidatus Norongarragalina meridionalis]|nr:Uncharacterised protein [Candidatus Norongarragalina meridionalis]